MWQLGGKKSPRPRNPIKFNAQYQVDFVVCFVFPNWHYISLWSCTPENHTWLLVQQDWSSRRRRSKYGKMISKAGIVLRKVPWEAGERGRKELNTTCVYISRSLLTYIPHYFWFWVKNNCIACCPHWWLHSLVNQLPAPDSVCHKQGLYCG